MPMIKNSEVRDGYLGDLPENIRINIMNIHKLITTTAQEVFKHKAYDPIRNSSWAKTMMDEFLVTPQDKKECGSVRVYKKGKRFSCMIQITGHIINNRNDIDHELFHDFVRHVHQNIRTQVRRKYDVTITCESEHGELFEGFDIWTKPVVAKELWELFNDKATKKIKPIKESTDIDHSVLYMVEMNELPEGLQDFVLEAGMLITEASHGKLKFDYRQVWDVKTGHRALLVYSLKGAKITYAGHGYLGNEDSINEVQKNIRSKGNTDHQSYGQKLLAIKDLETGEQLQEIECRGIFSNDSQNRKTYKLKVGDVENPDQKSFKSTKFINDLELMGKAEFIKDGRGTKLDNFSGVIIDGVAITNNPNKQQKEKIDKFKYRYIEMCMKRDDPDAVHAWNEGEPKYYNPDATKLATISEITKADVQKVADDINGQEKGAFHHSTANETSFLRQVLHKLQESSDIGYTEIIENTDGTYTGYITICECIYDPAMNKIINEINNCDPTKQVVYDESSNTFLLECTSEYANKLMEYLENVDSSESNKCFTEASQSTTKPNADEKEAKRSLAAVASGMINGNKPITQYTADIIANIITKSLLPIWAGGLRKLSIILDTKSKESIVEFKIPTITQDFVSRYVQGREPLEGFLRRNPDIKIRMTPAVFRSMTSADELFKFFKSAVKYYDSGVSKYAEKLMSNYIKLDHETKHLIANTKLSGLVTLPLQWLFQFDNVDMSKSDTFIISSNDINQINSFVKNIYTKYAAPEKEKKQIIEDLNSTIQAMKEFTEIDDNFRSSVAFQEAVNSWYNGQFNQLINKHNENWILEQVNTDWTYNPPSAEIKYLQEKFGVKKLKKIPADLVAYITIETEAIRDANDKMMIASYCISKLEIVEWYIELLEVGSNKYIVPHTKPYLESVRTQLLRCYANIMKVKITNPADRPIIDIKYPKGYEG